MKLLSLHKPFKESASNDFASIKILKFGLGMMIEQDATIVELTDNKF
ncbi:MAG: hypothetical protein JNJ65_10465 [Cyclobacteriaceae bacterium]|nr:hypothetical protein [Cyclobacteriaceae bacterium]